MEIAGKKISLFWIIVAVLAAWWAYRKFTLVSADGFWSLSDADVYKLRQVNYVDEDGYTGGGSLYDAFYQLSKSGRDTTRALQQVNAALKG